MLQSPAVFHVLTCVWVHSCPFLAAVATRFAGPRRGMTRAASLNASNKAVKLAPWSDASCQSLNLRHANLPCPAVCANSTKAQTVPEQHLLIRSRAILVAEHNNKGQKCGSKARVLRSASGRQTIVNFFGNPWFSPAITIRTTWLG